MEVHHHAHHEKKNWKSYIWEFLMLFLAVFCGFLAEYQLEHVIEKQKEKQAIASLVKCLEDDSQQLKETIAWNNDCTKNLDSLTFLKNTDLTNEENKESFLKYGFKGFTVDSYFKSNEAGMIQLKSSGLLRLIRKQNVIDSIFGYEARNKITVAQEADTYFVFKESLIDYKDIADLSRTPDTSVTSSKSVYLPYHKTIHYPISTDREKLKVVFNNAALLAMASEFYIICMERQLTYADKLSALLKKEYDLE